MIDIKSSFFTERNELVLLVSYESMILLGDAYVQLLYKTLGIDSDHKPFIKNSNSKYVKETAKKMGNKRQEKAKKMGDTQRKVEEYNAHGHGLRPNFLLRKKIDRHHHLQNRVARGEKFSGKHKVKDVHKVDESHDLDDV